MAYPLIVTKFLSCTEHKPTRIKVSFYNISATYGRDGLSHGGDERAREDELLGERAAERFLAAELPEMHADPHTLVACYDDTTGDYAFAYKTDTPVIPQQVAMSLSAIVRFLDDMTRQEVRAGISQCKDISDDAATQATTAYTYKLIARLLRQQLQRFATVG
tara:strand:- start:100 stop:585 length:486 start_codon:yes stop_codon:yes gene_type:complete